MTDAQANVKYEILDGHPSFTVIPIEDFRGLLYRVKMTEADLRLAPQFICNESNDPVHAVLLTTDFNSLQYGQNTPDPSSLFYLTCERKGASARALPMFPDRGLTVLEGSTMARDETATVGSTAQVLRRKLVEDGVVTFDTGKQQYTFQRNYHFDTPSQAAKVIAGYSTAETTDWRDLDGRSLQDHGL